MAFPVKAVPLPSESSPRTAGGRGRSRCSCPAGGRGSGPPSSAQRWSPSSSPAGPPTPPAGTWGPTRISIHTYTHTHTQCNFTVWIQLHSIGKFQHRNPTVKLKQRIPIHVSALRQGLLRNWHTCCNFSRVDIQGLTFDCHRIRWHTTLAMFLVVEIDGQTFQLHVFFMPFQMWSYPPF